MGLIRKVISGSAAMATGGLSLGVVQYRSDTERATRQTKLLRQEMERQHAEMLALQEEQSVRAEAEMQAAQLELQAAQLRRSAASAAGLRGCEQRQVPAGLPASGAASE